MPWSWKKKNFVKNMPLKISVKCWPFCLDFQIMQSTTLVSWIVEHIEISEHLAKFAEKLLIEQLFYTISIATNKRTPGTFCHCANNQTRLTIRDTGVRANPLVLGKNNPYMVSKICVIIVSDHLGLSFFCHYLNQWCLIVSWTLKKNRLHRNFN